MDVVHRLSTQPRRARASPQDSSTDGPGRDDHAAGAKFRGHAAAGRWAVISTPRHGGPARSARHLSGPYPNGIFDSGKPLVKNVQLRSGAARWCERFARGKRARRRKAHRGERGHGGPLGQHARGQRLDRVSFADRKPGRAWNRIRMEVEARILSVRRTLREDSVLGEYGPDAIGLALQEDSSLEQLPSRTTIYRVLERHGALDGTHRQRRPAPPKGWYLPALAKGQAELDSFDFIEDLKIAGGPLVSVLTATSLHGALADAWVVEHPSAKATLEALTDRWRREGLPTYAQFDNDTIFQGAHQFTDTVGRVSRLCLALQVIPVFAPPREHGFQNAIEGFNALWQSKVWQRHHCPDLASLVAVSGRYIIAYRVKTAARREAAPTAADSPKGLSSTSTPRSREP